MTVTVLLAKLMAMATTIIEPFTYQDLQSFPEDGKKREIIGGKLFVAAAPSTRHQKLMSELAGLIWLFLKTHPIAVVFFAPTEVMFDEFDSVEPDIFVVLKDSSRAEITEKRVVGAPDWIIEVLSPSNSDYDLNIKRKLYRNHGVLYWVISPVDETITVWDEEKRVYKAGDEIEVSVLPGFRLKVFELFEAVK